MHAPIQGSQINPPAKLYKRFTYGLNTNLGDDEHITDVDGVITIQDENKIAYENNNYVCHFSFAWVEATDLQDSELQPLRGLIIESSNMTIKMNAPYIQKRGDVQKPENGDIVQIGDTYWIIQDGVQRYRHKTLRNLATVYLPLKQLM